MQTRENTARISDEIRGETGPGLKAEQEISLRRRKYSTGKHGRLGQEMFSWGLRQKTLFEYTGRNI